MLNHFFGFFSFSGSESGRNRIKNALLGELAQFDARFQLISKNQDRAFIASNAFMLDSNVSKVGIALCGDLVATPSELTLAGMAAGGVDPSADLVKGLLRAANGTFAVALLDQELWLATDFLGGRPLFYAVHEGILIFGTAFELLKRLMPKACTLDLQAVSEDFCFGYPLGDRTLAKEIKVLRGGEYIHCCLNKIEIACYDKLPVDIDKFESVESSLEESAKALKSAIRERVQPGQEAQLALLSGGLDSRVIVSELLDAGYQVTAANYSLPGTLDRIYAQKFSELSATNLIVNEFRRQYQSISPGEITSFALNSAQCGLPMNKVFSGDGGGEIFGFIELKPGFFACAENSSVDDFVALMLHQLPSKHIAGLEFRSQIVDRCSEGLRTQLDEIGLALGLKAVYVLYLINDLRCHLHNYFSGLGAETRELLLPFYDRRVINAALRIPEIGKDMVGHRYYYRLLEYLSPKIKLTPWQSYPGSLGCPVDDNEKKGVSQWAYERNANLSDAASWARLTLQSLRNSDWNARSFRLRLMFLCYLSRIGVYKNSYIFKQVIRVSRYYSCI